MASSSYYEVGETVFFHHGRFIVREVNNFKDLTTGANRTTLAVQRVFKLNEKVKLVLPNTPMKEVHV